MTRQLVAGSGEGQHTALGATRAACQEPEQGSKQRSGLGATRPRHTGAFTDAVQEARAYVGPGSSPAGPVRRQAHLLCSLPMEEGLHIKGLLALAHIIDGPRQRMRQDRQGFSLALFFL
jgi:hypothetical protein